MLLAMGTGKTPLKSYIHASFGNNPYLTEKFEYELEPSAEVEVYRDGIWSAGVIEDVCNCEPRRYKVRVKHHGSADEDNFLVSSTSLRPYSKWDSQKWRPCLTKKHDRKRNDSVADCSSEFSISGGDSDRYSSDYSPEFSMCAEFSDQYSSDHSPEFFTADRDIDQHSYVPNKRVRKQNVLKEELPLMNSLCLGQHTAKSLSKNVIDMETIPEKEVTGVKQCESERKGLRIIVANEKDEILAASVRQKLIYTQCDEKGRHFLPKASASKRKELHSLSSLDDIVNTGSKSKCFDVVVISDDSSYGGFIEISDTSSSNSNRKKRRMNHSDKEPHSNHSVHQYHVSQSASNLSQAQNHHHDLSLEVARYSEEHASSCVISDSIFSLESSQDPSNKDAGKQIPLSGCIVQGLVTINETKEPELLENLHLETEMMSLGDSAAGDEPQEMCQKVAEVKSWMVGACKEVADSSQKTVNQSHGGTFPIGKLEPCSSGRQDVNADLLCIEAPNDNKMEIKTERSVMPPKEEAAFTNGKLEPCSSGRQYVNADLLCIEAPNDNKMEIKTERSVMPPKEEAAFTNGKLEPCSSGQQDVKADLLCIEAPNDKKVNTISISTTSSLVLLPPNQMAGPKMLEKMEIKNERTCIYPKDDAALPIGVIDPSSTGQQDVKDNLLCIQVPSNNKMEINYERTGMSLEAAEESFHPKTCMNSAKMIADVPHPQNSFGQLQVSISGKLAGPSSFVHPDMMVDLSAFMPLPVPSSSNPAPAFSTSSMLLMPAYKMEIFKRLPHIPHFREVQNCPPEFREGKALGLMVSFANMAESIKNMQIQDEARPYQEKMSSLLYLEENGFQVGPLKVRLHNLLCARNRQIHLKNRKTSLEKEILEIEATNCSLEQQVKFLDMCIMGLEEQKYQQKKAFVDTQKAANRSSISRLQAYLRQVEESLSKVEADFCSIAAAPWQSNVGSSLS